MAEIKISALPSASSLAGTEIIPLVQGGTTKEALLSLIETKIMTTADALMDAKIAAIPASPGNDSIYTASGDVFDTGIATTRRFSFNTDLDLTYNPFGNNAKLLFGQQVSFGGAASDSTGAISLVGTSTSSSSVISANFKANDKTIVFTGYNGARLRQLNVGTNQAQIYAETPTGYVQLTLDDAGMVVRDNRSTVLGLEYKFDYSADIILNDRSIPDVGTVKTLRQQANTWTTGTRPTPVAGVFGFNTDTSKFEGYTGATWVDFH